ncbi:MAG TPA: hypothetical protein DCE44_15350 [Verrucomicrobiales bacterium]|nr:hypothetical protein [Verrucomicrobiales bacterium]
MIIASPPFAPELGIEVSRVNLNLKLVLGRRYQLKSSFDLVNWTLAGEPFVADEESITKEFVIAEFGRYFQVFELR